MRCTQKLRQFPSILLRQLLAMLFSNPTHFQGRPGPKSKKYITKYMIIFFFHEMASHRSSQAENWTYRRHFTMCVFFCFGKSRTKQTKPSICKVTSFKLQHPTSTASIAILAQAFFWLKRCSKWLAGHVDLLRQACLGSQPQEAR